MSDRDRSPSPPSARLRRAGDAAVLSPCVSVCRMDPASGLCEGCLRTIDEIAGWGGMDDAQRLAVWTEIDRRRAAGTR